MPRRDDCEEPEHLRKLFIGNLSFNTTDDTLRDFFSEFGEIVDSVVMKNKETGKSRGFGFVTYSESPMVDVVQSSRPHKVDGRQVDTKRVVPKDEANNPESKMQVKKVFVGGIKHDMTEDDLREAFESYGAIKSASIPKDKATNKSRTFAFVDFEDHDSVDKVCLFKANIKVAGRQVNVRKAVDKEQMRNQEQRGGGSSNRGGGNFGNSDRGNNFGGGNYGNSQGGYSGNQGGGYSNQGGGFNNQGSGYNNQGGGYNTQGSGFNNQAGGYNNQAGGFNNQAGGFNNQGGNQGGGYSNQGGGYNNQGGGNQAQSSGNWGGNQAQNSGNWGGNQAQGSGNWGGNQAQGGGNFGNNQGGSNWGGNQGNDSNQGPMRNNSNYSNNRSTPYSSGGGSGSGYSGNRNY